MTRLNLMPWREMRRKEEDRDLLIVAGMVWAVAALIVFYVHFQVHALVQDQKGRNAFLQQQINLVDAKIKQIAQVKKERADLIGRMKVIEKLQTSRVQMVHEFDGMVRAVPKGVYLTSMKQANKGFQLTGVAQSNAQVSNFMRNLAASDWFGNPTLEVINVVRQGEQRVSQFSLQVGQADKPATDAATTAKAATSQGSANALAGAPPAPAKGTTATPATMPVPTQPATPAPLSGKKS